MLHRRVCILALCIFGIASATADTYIVNPLGTGDFPTIQAALNAASDGDSIELAEGTYTGDGNRDLDFMGKAITVRSQSGDADNCVIDCEGSEADLHRGFIFQSNEGPQSVVEGIMVTNGYADPGGGGAYCEYSASPTFMGCTFAGNGAHGGGGMWIYCSSAPNIIDCEFRDNWCTGQNGGGVLCGVLSEPSFTGCTFENNRSEGFGGGILCYTSSSAVLAECVFIGNEAWVTGGAAYCGWSSDVIFEKCIFAGNTGELGGGAVRCYEQSDAEIRQCTFYANGGTYGGGVYCTDSSHPLIENTIIAFSTEGEGVHCGGGSNAVLACCDLYGNEGGDWVGCVASQLGVNGNIWEDPELCAPEQLNFALREGSPCGPESNPSCGLIGAVAVGCGTMGVGEERTRGVGRVITFAAPNPFREGTEIRYWVPGGNEARIRLKVFDTAGRLVRILAEGVEGAGMQRVFWGGTDTVGKRVEAGVYFYELSVDDARATRRMILMP
ncbi:MAG: right-handed parallel beta-helix repeat-containing protein [Candidatus Eisenbacteria sp.]|nr:right-handed parallel beta-helix repeat-containing protein [Candidatus Eisenbacteria bacterium]